MIDFNQPQTVKPVPADAPASEAVQARDLRGLPLRGLLRAINHVLRQQVWARDRLIVHRGKSVRLGLDTLFPLAAFAPNLMTRISDDGLLEAADTPKPANSGAAAGAGGAGSGGAQALARSGADVSLWLKPSVDALFAGLRSGPVGLSSHLRVEGDVLLAAVMGELAQHLRWDFEEDLSRVVGDAGAHRVVAGAQTVGARLKDSQQRVESSAVQWLTVEGAYLLDRASWSDFKTHLNELNQAISRLETRASKRGA